MNSSQIYYLIMTKTTIHSNKSQIYIASLLGRIQKENIRNDIARIWNQNNSDTKRKKRGWSGWVACKIIGAGVYLFLFHFIN